MGKGFNNYMCKKPFHPGSKDNIKRAWMAEQRTENEKRKQDELKLQYDKEQDLYNNRSLVSKESKEKLALNFMYEAPPGAKREHQKEDDEPEYKFEWQRKYNAPREDFAKDNKEIRDQPFGISVRNVRCIKCHQWGHINTDRECPQFNQAGTSSGGVSMDPMELMKQMRDDGLQLKQSVLGHRFNAKQTNQMMVGSDDEQEGDPEVEFLKSLTSKQKKKLLQKLNKVAKKQDPKSDKKKRSKDKKKSKKKRKHRSKKASSSSDSSDSDTTKKEKGRKKKKHSSRRKHRSSRKDSSGDSSRSSSSSDDSSSSSSSSSSGSDNERRRKRKRSEERTVAPALDVSPSKKAKRSHKKKASKKDKHSREDSARHSQSSDSENSSAGEKRHKKKKKHKSKDKKHKSKSSSKEKSDPKTAGSLFADLSKCSLPTAGEDMENPGKFAKVNLKPKKIIDFDFEKCIGKDDARFEEERRSLLTSHDTSDDGSKKSFSRGSGKPQKIIDFDFDAVSSNVGPMFGDSTKGLLQGENVENKDLKSSSQKKNGRPPKVIDFDFDALEQQGLGGGSKPSASKPEKIIDFDIDLEKLEAAHGMGSRDKYSPSSPTTKRTSESSPDKEIQVERKLKFQDQGNFLRNPSPPPKGVRSMSPSHFSP